MQWIGPSMPAGPSARVLWAGLRLLVWVLLFRALDLALQAVILGLRLPLFGPYQLLPAAATLGAAILAGIVLLHWFDQRSANELGFPFDRTAPRYLAVGLALGAGALIVGAALQLLPGWLTFRRDSGTPVQWATTLLRDLGLLGIAAAAEEAVFRGYPFQLIVRAAGAPLAVALGSTLFTWAHTQNPNVSTFGLINIFLASVMLSVAYLVTKSLWFATAIHLGWNWSMASLIDLPVSGLEYFDTPLYEAYQSGPVWFTGGNFGPEGGLAGTIGIAVALAAVWWYGKRHRVMAET
jgi:membrane protease YdiL (CAAX protease family)